MGGSIAGRGELTVVDDVVDLVPSFSRHEPKVLKSFSWFDLIKEVGQRFNDGAVEFRDHLTKYSVFHGFQFYYYKNHKDKVKAYCVERPDGRCMWAVMASLDRSTGFFTIKEFNAVHTCDSAVLTNKISQIGCHFIGRLVTKELRSRPFKRAIDIMHDMKEDYGLDVTYRRSHMGLQKAKDSVFGSYSASFADLKWYVQKFKEVDSSSSIVLNCDDSKHFTRLFVGFGACKYGFNYCRPLLFLDGTFLKSMYKGSLLSACTKDGNQGLYPICFAIVDGETYESWHWSLEQMRVFLEIERNVVFISDRNIGLLHAVADVFPGASHSYCLVHLKKNLRTRLGGVAMDRKRYLVELFGKCAYAPTLELFNELLAELEREGGDKMRDFLLDLDVKHWAHAHFPGHRYSELSSNLAECFNRWIKDERCLPVTQLVDAIRMKLMEQMSRRKEESLRWKTTMCPTWDKRLTGLFQFSRTWVVRKSSADVYDVRGNPSNTVNICQRRCTCREWQLNCFPCVHAVCAIRKSGCDLNDFVEPCYLVYSFREAYSKSIEPIPTVYKPDFVADSDDVIVLPLQRRPIGRPRTERVSPMWKTTRKRLCSRCGTVARHNKRTCKEPLLS
ncbi:hypothetical protein RHMOL_RhmolUnG0002000 [Rhododendron molle]|nr:hypothetical protein RHMOL_RhmolUnG0002000 [Rhododendron molle]